MKDFCFFNIKERNMNYLPKSLATGFLLAIFASSSVMAATHPVTGETLAEDQTFTYSLLDEFTSVDPKLLKMFLVQTLFATYLKV